MRNPPLLVLAGSLAAALGAWFVVSHTGPHDPAPHVASPPTPSEPPAEPPADESPGRASRPRPIPIAARPADDVDPVDDEVVEPPADDDNAHHAAPASPVLAMFEFVDERVRAPADALVPAARRCKDPIVGVWVSREYFDEYSDWYLQELRVHRAGRGGALVGEIVARSWSGDKGDLSPKGCTGDGAFDWTVRMPASGRIDGTRVEFRGLSLRIDRPRCGDAPTPAGYSLDSFEGWLLDDRGYLVAYNNDGGRASNERHVFRRVVCE